MSEQIIEVSTHEPVFSGKAAYDNDGYLLSVPTGTKLYDFLEIDSKRIFDLRFHILDYNCFMRITAYTKVTRTNHSLIFNCICGQLVDSLDVCEDIERFKEKYLDIKL